MLTSRVKSSRSSYQPSKWTLGFWCQLDQLDQHSRHFCASSVLSCLWLWLRVIHCVLRLLEMGLNRLVCVRLTLAKSLICALSPTAMENQQSMSQYVVIYSQPIVNFKVSDCHLVGGMHNTCMLAGLCRTRHGPARLRQGSCFLMKYHVVNGVRFGWFREGSVVLWGPLCGFISKTHGSHTTAAK